MGSRVLSLYILFSILCIVVLCNNLPTTPWLTLPPNWTSHDHNGRTYYYNSVTGKTSWERPTEGGRKTEEQNVSHHQGYPQRQNLQQWQQKPALTSRANYAQNFQNQRKTNDQIPQLSGSFGRTSTNGRPTQVQDSSPVTFQNLHTTGGKLEDSQRLEQLSKELKQIVDERDQLRKELISSVDSKSIVNQSLAETNAKNQMLTAKLEELEETIKSLNKQLAAIEEERWQLMEDVKALEEDLDILELVLEESRENRTILKGELRLARARILDQDKELNTTYREIGELRIALGGMKTVDKEQASADTIPLTESKLGSSKVKRSGLISRLMYGFVREEMVIIPGKDDVQTTDEIREAEAVKSAKRGKALKEEKKSKIGFLWSKKKPLVADASEKDEAKQRPVVKKTKQISESAHLSAVRALKANMTALTMVLEGKELLISELNERIKTTEYEAEARRSMLKELKEGVEQLTEENKRLEDVAVEKDLVIKTFRSTVQVLEDSLRMLEDAATLSAEQAAQKLAEVAAQSESDRRMLEEEQRAEVGKTSEIIASLNATVARLTNEYSLLSAETDGLRLVNIELEARFSPRKGSIIFHILRFLRLLRIA